MAKTTTTIDINSRNTEVPYFPSSGYELFNADFGDVTLPTFNWIQATFDAAAITVSPQLVVWSGDIDPDTGAYISTLVLFAYSGERINFKGKAILATGTDVRGNSITSTPIGATAASDLARVLTYGGMF